MPPRTQLELALAEIWAEVVGAPCDDVRDDFFRSGGDSIGAASLIARASSRLGVGDDLGTRRADRPRERAPLRGLLGEYRGARRRTGALLLRAGALLLHRSGERE